MESRSQQRQLFSTKWLIGIASIIALYIAPQILGSPSANEAKSISLSVQVVLNTEHAKVATYTLESAEPFFATVNHPQGHTAAASILNQKTQTHTLRVAVMLDHVATHRCVKELLRVGNAGGHSIESVSEKYSLDANTNIPHLNGTFKRGERTSLLEWNGRTYSLSVK